MTSAMSSPKVPAGPPFREPMLSLRGITKAFPGVLANDDVSLDVAPGEVHALLGENGAGKTTLMNILYGIYQPDGGEIRLRGRPARIRSPRDAIALGIGMVPQHAVLVRRHTVAENIALGMPQEGLFFPARRVVPEIVRLSQRYGLLVDPRARIRELAPSEQQRVEIIRALIRGAQILILDEPTSVLTPQEARGLFEVLGRMKAEGHAVIFITHKLDEVTAVADRVTVLRRGSVVETLPVADVDKRSLARMMVGRDVDFRRPLRAASGEIVPATVAGETLPGSLALELEHVSAALEMEGISAKTDRGLPALRGVSLVVRRGEILGIAGVAGNGQRELVEVVTGLRPAGEGRVRVVGRDLTNRSAREVHEAGVAHIPEDRLLMGIVPQMTVAENLVLKRYRYTPFSRGATLDLEAITGFARNVIAEYQIATPDVETPARLLSGGNIQKLILGRELSGAPGLVVASHPTAGLDISATSQIHTLLLSRSADGAGILLVSEDLDEILTLADRIAVLFGGEIVGVVPGPGADREQIGLMMAGHTGTASPLRAPEAAAPTA